MTNPSVLILRITAAILIILGNLPATEPSFPGRPPRLPSGATGGANATATTATRATAIPAWTAASVCRMTALPTLKRAASKCTKPAV